MRLPFRGLRLGCLLLVTLPAACARVQPAGDTGGSLEPVVERLAVAPQEEKNPLRWTMEEKLAGFPNYDRLFSTREIPASATPYPLPTHLHDLTGIHYRVDGESYTLEDFLEHNHVVGLLAIKGGNVVLERYRLGNDRSTRWVSYSVAKSVVSMLVGAAIEDGYITSIDQPVTDFLPLLKGSAYDGVSIRNVLQMASGVEWNEDYTDPEADVSREDGLNAVERLRYLSTKPRVAEPGERFNYNTAETHLVGSLLRAAIGNNLATYLEDKLWGPFGMESDANWRLVEPGGGEHGGCCISATLRDYGRIGLFALHDGVLRDDTRVLPERWIEESTTPSKANPGYGYLWWLFDDGTFNALGIFGQAISIDRANDLVVVTHSAWPSATDREMSQHFVALRQALVDALR